VGKTGITPTFTRLRRVNPAPSEAVSQFVISRKKAGDPEVREMLPFPWIPDLAMLRVARPE